MDQLAYFWTREIIKWVPFTYLKVLKKLEYALHKALLAFFLYSNSILCAFKSMQNTHYMVIYTNITCIILYSKSFMYIKYSFWSHSEYILSTSVHHQTPGSLAISDLCTLFDYWMFRKREEYYSCKYSRTLWL